MSEQIFISYRRDGGDTTAKLICETLKNRGYTVFFDYESIHGGYFDDRIFQAIKGCTDFVLVLPAGALDRCQNERDWVRQEIACALSHGKNIIPVMLPDFTFPAGLPADIAQVSRINGVKFVMEYYESVVDSIVKRLHARPYAAPAKAPQPTQAPAREQKSAPAPVKKSAPAPAPKKKKSSPVPVIIVAILVLALLGAAGVAAILPHLKAPDPGVEGDTNGSQTGEDGANVIRSAEDLQKLIGSDATFSLGCDLDLGSAAHTPIEGFTGTLLGNGHTVKNFKITADASDVGFFSVLEGEVKDLKLEDATIEVSGRCENVGILCGQLKGQISGIEVSGSVTAEKSANVGGVCGLVSTKGTCTLDAVSSAASVLGRSSVGGCFGKIDNYVQNGISPFQMILSNAKNSGSVTAAEDYAGGIVGYCQANADGFNGSTSVKIVDCENTGEITGGYFVAGIAGYACADAASTIQGCTNASLVNAKAYVGCIAGATEQFTILDCSNQGSTLNATDYYMDGGKKYAYVGGIVGSGACTQDCTNYIDITYTGGGDFVGGLMGYCTLGAAAVGDILVEDVQASYKNLVNKGNVSGSSYVGGIMGGAAFKKSAGGAVMIITLEGLCNEGTVTADGDFAGGISGLVAGAVIGFDSRTSWCIYDCTNRANVTARANAGGLFGSFKNGPMDENANAINTVTMDGCSSSGTVTADSDFGELIGLDQIAR